jgi:hypothetical protein
MLTKRAVMDRASGRRLVPPRIGLPDSLALSHPEPPSGFALIDVFHDDAFTGNPLAVVSGVEPDTATMQAMAPSVGWPANGNSCARVKMRAR